MDVISSKNEFALKSSISQLQGSLQKRDQRAAGKRSFMRLLLLNLLWMILNISILMGMGRN